MVPALQGCRQYPSLNDAKDSVETKETVHIGNNMNCFLFMNADSVLFCQYFLFFLLGASAGSFLECMAERIIKGQSWTVGRSHCDMCGHVLGIRDLIPIVSFFANKGRCRYCHGRIPVSCLFSELLMAFVFTALFLRHGMSWNMIRCLLVSSALFGLSRVDLECYMIPDGFEIFLILVWAAFLPVENDPLDELMAGAASALIFLCGLMLAAWLFERATGKEGIGFGDIKLIAVMALYFHVTRSLYCLILACTVGIVFFLALQKERIPFGPSIAIASLILMLA